MRDDPAFSDKQTRVIEAAFGCFSAYGFKRTTMADIAKAAGMSRPALYLLFAGKRDIGRAIITEMKTASLQNAAAVLAEARPFSERLRDALHFRETAFLETIEGSRHGQELFETGMELAADILLDGEQRFSKILQKALRKAVRQGEIKLIPGKLSVPRLAEILIAGAHGQKTGAATARILRRRIDDFLELVLAGLLCEQDTL
ncbi:Transcriptional regulator, AcrR family [hydrothermal vent metagenome]|uniref:Transcriptional regulator, AcrR family n=1 Tax=hydrothermal vent metagenome TaxID=652676 RepID=A0A3B0RSD1_9ZZZZ